MTETPIKFRLIRHEETGKKKVIGSMWIKYDGFSGHMHPYYCKAKDYGTASEFWFSTSDDFIYTSVDRLVCVMNGEEWYEGDVFEMVEIGTDEKTIVRLEWSPDFLLYQFRKVPNEWALSWADTSRNFSIKKLGNRYEHPELLEGKDE